MKMTPLTIFQLMSLRWSGENIKLYVVKSISLSSYLYCGLLGFPTARATEGPGTAPATQTQSAPPGAGPAQDPALQDLVFAA